MRIDITGTIVSSDDAWIYDYFGIEYTCPKQINEAIKKANGSNIDVYINSGGGDIFAGSEIYSAIRSYSGTVKIHVVGLAASAASVIACAAKSDISPTAMIMVHNVSTGASGDYHVMDKESEVLKKANQSIAAAYVAKTGMSESEVLSLMDTETWLTASDAVAKGMIDEISTPQNMNLVAAYGCTLLPNEVIEKIRNTVKNPTARSNFFMSEAKKAQAKLNFLKLKGKNIND